ncbi:MAG: glycerophosphodiester phosphodiesterase [Chloroflexi bacterium HGW-Chloroflexi-3]|nr:MAG: glycerophosphodiester phosphodiesterase [Chloroflexi bacterium HGW-Chloroflexi-3]
MKMIKHTFFILLILTLSGLSLVACSSDQTTSINPNFEEKPMPANDSKVTIIAHRGARSIAPENTISAAKRAFENHADGWELDVAMSVDGELVVLHDDTLERTSNVAEVFPDRSPWSVNNFTLEDLKKLDVGSWFVDSDPFDQIAQGIVPPEIVNEYVGEPIPMLREALIYTKDNQWWVNIEIKDASETPADAVIVSKVVALVEELDIQDQVLISSFNMEYLKQVKSINKDLPTGVLVNKIIMDPLALMKELDAQAFHPGMKVTYEKQVKLLLEEGYAVNVWTVNEESDMQKLIEMGVTGIITDYPQRAFTLLNP